MKSLAMRYASGGLRVRVLHASEKDVKDLPPLHKHPADGADAWTIGGEWRADKMCTADGIAHLQMNYRRVTRLMVEAAAKAKAEEIVLVINVQQDKKQGVLKYSTSFRYKGDAPDFMGEPFSQEEEDDDKRQQEADRAASSPFAR